ncbi:hypothetical protein ACX27_07850 [Nostoc piscinale CENA21]|uniref:DUF732 domain-containing protein n=1 Tax=Nostoc piscinale CENA21 TaxID=224013 RepID=A0A0M4T2R2_9NOSO|nr:DUF732 domain-containing protein [Nostoc piscinale]ALF52791.1 hypothetical protein ACX27_07850 [Nostoc piscinale CENA21]
MRKLTAFIFTLGLLTPYPVIAQPISPESLYLKLVDYQLKQSGNFLIGITNDRKIIDGKFVCRRFRSGASKEEIINTFLRVVSEFDPQIDSPSGNAMLEYLSVTSATGVTIFCPEFKGWTRFR